MVFQHCSTYILRKIFSQFFLLVSPAKLCKLVLQTSTLTLSDTLWLAEDKIQLTLSLAKLLLWSRFCLVNLKNFCCQFHINQKKRILCIFLADYLVHAEKHNFCVFLQRHTGFEFHDVDA